MYAFEENISNFFFCVLGVDGSTTQQSRQNMVINFNKNNKIKLFLFSTKAGCMGTNLVGANRVILFDSSFNPCDDLQAIARVYRYGQLKKVIVYRFIMDQTLEKSIYDHQINKREMSHRVIDNQHLSSQATITSDYLFFEDLQEPEIKDFSASADKYSDYTLISLLKKFSSLFAQEPLIRSYIECEDELTKSESVLAKIEFALAKATVEDRATKLYENCDTNVTAFRRSGHALVGWLLGKDVNNQLRQLYVSLSGHVVESIIFKQFSSVDNNIKSVARIAYTYIYETYHQQQNYDQPYSEEYNKLIDNKVNDLISDVSKETAKMLMAHSGILVSVRKISSLH